MGYIVIAIISAAIGAGAMYAALSCKMVDEGFEQFNKGYKLGVEDGKRMKGGTHENKIKGS